MARRIYEQELLRNEGIPFEPMKAGKNVEVLKEIKFHKSHKGVFSMQFNYTGEILAVGYGAGGIQLYDTQKAETTGQLIRELRPCRQGGDSIMALRFSPKDPDLLYAATAEGYIYVYNIQSGELSSQMLEQGNEINTLDFSVDGYNFVTGGKDLAVRVYETKNDKLVTTYKGLSRETVTVDPSKQANTMRIFSMKFHPNMEYIFLSGGWDNHIKIWDIRDNDGIKRTFHGPHLAGDALDFKGNTILTGQWAALHALQMYDYTSERVVKEIKYPNTNGAFLYVTAYLNDTTVMAGGSGTNCLDVIEIDTDRHIGQYKMNSPIHAADSAKDGRLIAVGGADSSFAILRMNEQ